jgi:fluoroquinolone resistance protein
MTEKYFQDENFASINSLLKGSYEYCTFTNCNLAEHNLSDFKFTDCTFTDCNLSMAILINTAFRTVTFKGCKMLGLGFEKCNDFGLAFSFDQCQLNHTTFFKTKIKNTVFKNTQLIDVDFTQADLTKSIFDNCNLEGATFDHTVLEKSDFRTSYNYIIDPDNNKIRRAMFSVSGIVGLLAKYDIDIVP